jgi:phospholipid/cholesterol/gamma-HCH transport system substrate-binding protein
VSVSKELKVGLLAIISITILYFGFQYLKGKDLFTSNSKYYAVYENIDGLKVSNPIIINGLNVGAVSKIRIMQDRGNLVLVEMDIDGEIKIKKGASAKLMNTDLLGSKAIEVFLPVGDRGLLKEGDTLKSEVDAGIAAFLEESGKPIADNLETTIARLNEALAILVDNREKLDGTFTNIENFTLRLNTLLARNQANIQQLLFKLNANADSLLALQSDMRPVLREYQVLGDSLNNIQFSQTVHKLDTTLANLNSTLKKIDEGKGTLGKLVNDDSLYINLNNTARDLDSLLIDLKQNPGRYVQFSVF